MIPAQGLLDFNWVEYLEPSTTSTTPVQITEALTPEKVKAILSGTMPVPTKMPVKKIIKKKEIISETTKQRIIDCCSSSVWKNAQQISEEIHLSKTRLLTRYLKPMVDEEIIEISDPKSKMPFYKRSFKLKQK